MLPIRDVEPILRPIFASDTPASRRLDALLGLAKLLARDLEPLGLPDELAERLALTMLLPWVKA